MASSTYYGKAYKLGKSLIITIPKNVRDVLHIENGEMCEIRIQKLKEVAENESKTN